MKFEFLGAEVAKVIHLGNDLQEGGGCTLWGGGTSGWGVCSRARKDKMGKPTEHEAGSWGPQLYRSAGS